MSYYHLKINGTKTEDSMIYRLQKEQIKTKYNETGADQIKKVKRKNKIMIIIIITIIILMIIIIYLCL